MSIRGISPLFIALVFMGAAISPCISRASFADDLRKIHDESQEQRDMRREQFRQDILEKRKEVFTKWASKKDQWEEKLQKEGARVMSGFDLRRTRKETNAHSSLAAAIRIQEAMRGGFFFIMRKSIMDMIHFFSPLEGFLSDPEQ